MAGLAGITCLVGRLNAEDGIGIQLPAGPDAHRAGSGIAERHACVGCEHAAVVGEPEAEACVDRDPAVGLELGVRPKRPCIVRGPEPIGRAPGSAPRWGDGERQASTRGAWSHADRPAHPPFLVLAVLVRDERPPFGLDREGSEGVSQSRADLDSGAGLGVAAVVAQSDFSARGERCAVAGLKDALALEDQPQARHVASRRGELARVGALRADPHRIGFHVHREPATGAVEHFALDSYRAHAH